MSEGLRIYISIVELTLIMLSIGAVTAQTSLILFRELPAIRQEMKDFRLEMKEEFARIHLELKEIRGDLKIIDGRVTKLEEKGNAKDNLL